MHRFAHIDNWIFDLDDTLYSRQTGLMQQIDKRMTAYVSEHLKLDAVEARRLQKHFYHQHGTTLRGLMLEYKTDPQHFLDYVHDIDYAALIAEARLREALRKLPGRKFIYTNGSARHAEKIVEGLGLIGEFEGIFDIAAGSYIPKPQPDSYQSMLQKFSIAAERGVMLDDLVRNLIPAAKVGLTTVWIRQEHSIPAEDPHVTKDYLDYIHHTAHDMLLWLEELTKERINP